MQRAQWIVLLIVLLPQLMFLSLDKSLAPMCSSIWKVKRATMKTEDFNDLYVRQKPIHGGCVFWEMPLTTMLTLLPNPNHHSTSNAGAYLCMYHCCWHGNTSIFTCLIPAGLCLHPWVILDGCVIPLSQCLTMEQPSSWMPYTELYPQHLKAPLVS